MLYDKINKQKASILCQLRTGKCRLNTYLSRIGAADNDQCKCGAMVSAKYNIFHSFLSALGFVFHSRFSSLCTLICHAEPSPLASGNTHPDLCGGITEDATSVSEALDGFSGHSSLSASFIKLVFIPCRYKIQARSS